MSAKFFIHIDLDAFFASVEILDNPALQRKPVIVGALPGNRGVVSTCSYEARAFGIRSGMPISEAYRLCPSAVFLPVRIKRYSEVSNKVMEILSGFTPDMLQISIDEASLDMTGTERLWGTPLETAHRIQDAVSKEIGISCSLGIASNRYVAKIASDIHKPHGITYVQPGTEAAFMQELPLKKLWGAGKKTQERFAELGIVTVKQLAGMSESMLKQIFGNAFGEFLYLAVHGHDPGIYQERKGSQSLSTEETFELDISDREFLETKLLTLCEEVMERLYNHNASATTVFLKIRYDNFITVNVQKTLKHPIFNCSELFSTACALLYEKWNGQPVRLLGLGVSNITETNEHEQYLFADSELKQAKAEKTAAELKKQGRGKIIRARDLLIKSQPRDNTNSNTEE
ncbi:MAG TPA: DNA polymerase IV [Spirochaetia bacterium]|nr:DNA polymerase IV [Spirochaetales bacterium]HQK34093.1 DNA polymerase IV [Spirochaetales bacterium]HRS65814.1 DNA polymerase IV [Spirochaetia bacterium]HRV28628.1 DNA polymerase IV [Spirochaetia bacterium]